MDADPPVYGCCERQPFLEQMARLETLDEQLGALAALGTGDLLLYQNADLGSVFNLTAMQASFGHVGIVIELDPDVARELIPPDYADGPRSADKRLARLHVFEAVEGRGVCLFPLEARLARCIKYNRYLAVRRHEGEINPAQQRAALDFVRLVRGRELAVATQSCGLLRNVLRLYLPCVPSTPEGDRVAFSCSELVVAALFELGILPVSAPLTASGALPTFLTTADGMPNQLRLDRFLSPGHRFRKETLFLFPGAPILAHLQRVKRALSASAVQWGAGGDAAQARAVLPRRFSVGSVKEAIELM